MKSGDHLEASRNSVAMETLLQQILAVVKVRGLSPLL